MSIREAILKAADHIEANPHLYNFCFCLVPGMYGNQGCMMAWTAYFMGYAPGTCSQETAGEYLGVSTVEFLGRTGKHGSRMVAENAVKDLRHYADKYHPAEALTISSELDRIFADARRVSA